MVLPESVFPGGEPFSNQEQTALFVKQEPADQGLLVCRFLLLGRRPPASSGFEGWLYDGFFLMLQIYFTDHKKKIMSTCLI